MFLVGIVDSLEEGKLGYVRSTEYYQCVCANSFVLVLLGDLGEEGVGIFTCSSSSSGNASPGLIANGRHGSTEKRLKNFFKKGREYRMHLAAYCRLGGKKPSLCSLSSGVDDQDNSRLRRMERIGKTHIGLMHDLSMLPTS